MRCPMPQRLFKLLALRQVPNVNNRVQLTLVIPMPQSDIHRFHLPIPARQIDAQRLLNVALKEWQISHPRLATWAQTNLPEGFAVFNLPDAHRVRMRTTNGLERLNKELKRRTRVATLFPNPDSCKRLERALLAEQDEEWMTAKIYLNMKPWPDVTAQEPQNQNRNLQNRCCFIPRC